MLLKHLAIYRDRRIASIFALGIISGLPWVMIGSALTLWLQESGISRSAIGFAGLIFTAYTFNFLWAPLVDRFAPKLWKNAGKKQAWIIVCQIIIALCCIAMSFFSPSHSAKTLILIGLILAFASATQDIAIDAYRIQCFNKNESDSISAAAAATTSGWWTGYAAIGFIPLALSDMGWSWPVIYQLLSVITLGCVAFAIVIPTTHSASALSNTQSPQVNASVIICQNNIQKYALIGLMLLPWLIALWAIIGVGLPPTITQSSLLIPIVITVEIALFGLLLRQLNNVPVHTESTSALLLSTSDKLINSVYVTLILPLRTFIARNGMTLALALLSFIFLFKIGEAFLGRMSIVFYKEIGFSTLQIASYSKTLTWLVTVACAIPCGLLNAKMGLFKGLVISGLCMAASNLLFCALAIIGPAEWLYVITVIIDGFTTAWATVAFVAFISHLCDHQFSATQYALLASLGNLGRTLLASNSGLLVDFLNGNWALFFAITAVMIMPSLILLWSLRHKLLSVRAQDA
ncbi:MAG: MFS transporter [Marinagarivorans sp.]|nr:MFS transporter [Marinagarivorans sp.]